MMATRPSSEPIETPQSVREPQRPVLVMHPHASQRRRRRDRSGRRVGVGVARWSSGRNRRRWSSSSSAAAAPRTSRRPECRAAGSRRRRASDPPTSASTAKPAGSPFTSPSASPAAVERCGRLLDGEIRERRDGDEIRALRHARSRWCCPWRPSTRLPGSGGRRCRSGRRELNSSGAGSTTRPSASSRVRSRRRASRPVRSGTSRGCGPADSRDDDDRAGERGAAGGEAGLRGHDPRHDRSRLRASSSLIRSPSWSTRPSASSAAVACSIVMPTISGRTRGAGPLLTTSAKSSPRSRRTPAPESVRMTTPFVDVVARFSCDCDVSHPNSLISLSAAPASRPTRSGTAFDWSRFDVPGDGAADAGGEHDHARSGRAACGGSDARAAAAARRRSAAEAGRRRRRAAPGGDGRAVRRDAAAPLPTLDGHHRPSAVRRWPAAPSSRRRRPAELLRRGDVAVGGRRGRRRRRAGSGVGGGDADSARRRRLGRRGARRAAACGRCGRDPPRRQVRRGERCGDVGRDRSEPERARRVAARVGEQAAADRAAGAAPDGAASPPSAPSPGRTRRRCSACPAAGARHARAPPRADRGRPSPASACRAGSTAWRPSSRRRTARGR